jgi:hypothetical protein
METLHQLTLAESCPKLLALVDQIEVRARLERAVSADHLTHESRSAVRQRGT